jgi:uncharacterized protein
VTPDVNVLVAASRSDHPHHAVARAWVEQAVADAGRGLALLKLQPMVIASFLRLVTHPKIFVYPTPMREALRFVDALLSAPGVEQPALGPSGPRCPSCAPTWNSSPTRCPLPGWLQRSSIRGSIW